MRIIAKKLRRHYKKSLQKIFTSDIVKNIINGLESIKTFQSKIDSKF